MSILIKPARDLEFSVELLRNWEAKWVFHDGCKRLLIPEIAWQYYRQHHAKFSSVNYIDIIGPSEIFGTLKNHRYFLNTENLEKPLEFKQPDLSFQWFIDRTDRSVHVLRYKTGNFLLPNLFLADIGWKPGCEDIGLIIDGEGKSYIDCAIACSLANSYGWIALKMTYNQAVVVHAKLIEKGDDDIYLKCIGDFVSIPVTVDI